MRRLRQNINRGDGVHLDRKKESKKNPDFDAFNATEEEIEERFQLWLDFLRYGSPITMSGWAPCCSPVIKSPPELEEE